MICAIMQPTYLPWLGYFDLMDSADIFVLLDDVQFSPKSWQQRNRIRTPNGLEWLTLPVKGQFGRNLNETEITGKPFAGHFRRIQQAYKGLPGCNHLIHCLESIYSAYDAHDKPILSELNREIITWLRTMFNIKARVVRSSELGVPGKRAEKCAAICELVGAKQYLAVPGSVEYLLEEREAFDRRGIEILVQNYTHPWYPQHAPIDDWKEGLTSVPFIAGASAIDCLINTGGCSRGYMIDGRKDPTPLDKYELFARLERSSGRQINN